jgi:hypothetical protein
MTFLLHANYSSLNFCTTLAENPQKKPQVAYH